MKMLRAMRVFLGCVLLCLAYDAFAVEPTISGVTVRQRWPWSRLVDIDYVLSCDPTQQVSVAVNGYNGSVPLVIPARAFSGDLYGLSDGAHRIIFDPTTTAYTNNEVMTQFRVSLTPTDSPLYMIVDLTLTPGVPGQIEYVTEADLTAGLYGTVQTNPVAGITSIVWTGVTTDSVYKDQKLVLRWLHAGSNQAIAIDKDYLVSVFELTQNQWKRITGTYPICKFSAKNGPVEKNASYDVLRGSKTDGIDWPTTGSDVSTNSFIAAVREKTGVFGFDLPDNDQWQYACRAGSTTFYNDNDASATTSTPNAWLELLGCYTSNSGNQTDVAGIYKPNAWGLYDMHGNVQEWSLNASGSNRTRWGGAYLYSSDRCISDYFTTTTPADDDPFGMNGFRLIINMD